ncbi:UDP-N-acetylmuramate--L-alanine ligase [Coxiella endosymbiont of Amblyomma nuttalli]|uniref:UDP-N-acetylmuramate--L-alanine ligase n=1 Tax=Coxiella endosymbiont of Amblyomma nuttalli TaxID=2749996 RepID=UPI001BAA01CE|nr:UDP-N-acetylmuramate--L-alanine ligase [Coxiella endosymbiont of Amblyomma nuttalli]QTS83757.1 UDP-N-acetylmuramate--L-alanine ligase [Coxiella endosymbiont of Amblyomma nuttalli]
MLFDNKRIKHMHCLGIGGIGVSALAEILLKKGYRVTGSDISRGTNTERLQRLGAEIAFNHAGTIVTQADCAIYSSAIATTNPELMAAKRANVPLLKRGQMLANVMADYYSIAVAGTHGKTTTSAMLANAFVKANLDPTFMVGGTLNDGQTPARVGKGRYFIAEADESDASFLFMKPNIAIVTNIDADHLSTYDGDFNHLKQTYVQFLHQIIEKGVAVLCIDDPIIQRLIPTLSQRVVTYGFSSSADYRADNFCQKGIQGYFEAYRSNHAAHLSVRLNMPGHHNALNALAVIAVADLVEMDEYALLQSLAAFPGVDRRFAIRGNMITSNGNALILEDYGHHPNEIRATLTAARAAWPNRRIILVFQPHRYTRTRDLMAEFAFVLMKPDLLILLEVYSAGESLIPEADGKSLLKVIEQNVQQKPVFVPYLQDLPATLQTIVQPNDIVILQGAGNIGSIVTTIVNSATNDSKKI